MWPYIPMGRDTFLICFFQIEPMEKENIFSKFGKIRFFLFLY